MEEWNEKDFQQHVNEVEYNKRIAMIQKDMIRNIEYEDEIQRGFDKGFENGLIQGKLNGYQLAMEILSKEK